MLRHWKVESDDSPPFEEVFLWRAAFRRWASARALGFISSLCKGCGGGKCCDGGGCGTTVTTTAAAPLPSLLAVLFIALSGLELLAARLEGGGPPSFPRLVEKESLRTPPEEAVDARRSNANESLRASSASAAMAC